MVSIGSYFRAYPNRFRLTGWHLRQGMPGVPFRWVATRRGLTKPVSSSPPFRAVRETFTSYGSKPPIQSPRKFLKRLFPFPLLHGAFPVDSLRVRKVPFVRSFRRLGAFAFSPRPGVDSFPVFRLLCPNRLLMRHRSFVGLSLAYFPPSLASVMRSPVFPMEDSSKTM